MLVAHILPVVVLLALLPAALATGASIFIAASALIMFIIHAVVRILIACCETIGVFFAFPCALWLVARDFATTGGGREFLRAAAICTVITMMLYPLFMG